MKRQGKNNTCKNQRNVQIEVNWQPTGEVSLDFRRVMLVLLKPTQTRTGGGEGNA
jgi:hypothetical protein